MPRLPLLLLGLLLGWLTACATVGVPSEAQVAFDQGLSLFHRGQYVEAIPLLQEATTLDPQFGQAYLYLGRSYVNLGQWGNAMPMLRTAFRLAPEASQHESTQLLLDALLGGATAALKTGGFREAVGLLHEALGLAPHGQHLLPPLVEALIGWGGNSWRRGNSATRSAPFAKRPTWLHSRWTRMWDWHGLCGNRASSSKPWQRSRPRSTWLPTTATCEPCCTSCRDAKVWCQEPDG
jgi:tetratricopeptide (TPR) repeat protein